MGDLSFAHWWNSVKANRFQPPWPHLAVIRSLQNRPYFFAFYRRAKASAKRLRSAIVTRHARGKHFPVARVCSSLRASFALAPGLRSPEKWGEIYRGPPLCDNFLCVAFQVFYLPLQKCWTPRVYVFFPSSSLSLSLFLVEFHWPVAYFFFFSFSISNIDNRDTETISAFSFRLYWLFTCLCFTRRGWLCDFPHK